MTRVVIEHRFPWPCCGSAIGMPSDLSADADRNDEEDCEVCRRPIALHLTVAPGVSDSFHAERGRISPVRRGRRPLS